MRKHPFLSPQRVVRRKQGSISMSDFRSDTLTRPTKAMYDSMMNLELGDETLFGDPTVKKLEARAAAMTGKEAAMFVASGTMGNIASILTHRKGGLDILVDEDSHIARVEFGGMSVLAGLYGIRVPSDKGQMNLTALREVALHSCTNNRVAPTLICVETTHNRSGGCVPGMEYLRAVHALGREIGTPVHIDGARVFNAAVALGVPVSDIAACGETMTFCLSKGLSAPYGAMLVGPKDFIHRAHIIRRMLGGGMRQIGIMAAAGLVALDSMVDRLADDHRRCRALWEGVRTIDPVLTDDFAPMSNIMHIYPRGTVDAWVKQYGEHGVTTRPGSPKHIRMVTHREITDADVTRAIDATAKIFAASA